MEKTSFRTLVATIFATVLSTAVFAAEPVERTDTTTLWFENWGGLRNATLTVVAPDGTYIDSFSDRGSPRFSLRDIKPVEDGVYSYELSAATDKMQKIKNPINNGRGKAAKTEIPIPFQSNGFFIVERGAISAKAKLVEEK